MKRRAFFGKIGRVAAALGAGAWLKGCVEAAPVHAQMLTPAATDLAPGSALTFEKAVDPQTGVAIRFVKAFDIQADTQPTRFDAFVAQPPLRTGGPLEGLLHQVTEGERARYQAAYLRASVVARREAMEAGELTWWSVDARAVELVHVAGRYQRGELTPRTCGSLYYDLVTDRFYDRQTLEELVPLGPADVERAKRLAAQYREGVLSPEFGSYEWYADPASPHAVPPTFVAGRDLGDETPSGTWTERHVDRFEEGYIETLPDGTQRIRPDKVTGRVRLRARF